MHFLFIKKVALIYSIENYLFVIYGMMNDGKLFVCYLRNKGIILKILWGFLQL